MRGSKYKIRTTLFLWTRRPRPLRVPNTIRSPEFGDRESIFLTTVSKAWSEIWLNYCSLIGHPISWRRRLNVRSETQRNLAIFLYVKPTLLRLQICNSVILYTGLPCLPFCTVSKVYLWGNSTVSFQQKILSFLKMKDITLQTTDQLLYFPS